MSMEKSLLTIESIKDSLATVDLNFRGVEIPIGVTPCGNLERAKLADNVPNTHMFLAGLTGSGRSKYIHFLLDSLVIMYGSEIKIHYIDCYGIEVKRYQKTQRHECRIPNSGVLAACDSIEEVEAAVKDLVDELYEREEESAVERAIVVLDGIDSVSASLSLPCIRNLIKLKEDGPSVGMHILWTSQSSDNADIVFDWDFALCCSTRIHPTMSIALYGNEIGTCVRKYGDIVYSYGGSQGKARVPYTL